MKILKKIMLFLSLFYTLNATSQDSLKTLSASQVLEEALREAGSEVAA